MRKRQPTLSEPFCHEQSASSLTLIMRLRDERRAFVEIEKVNVLQVHPILSATQQAGSAGSAASSLHLSAGSFTMIPADLPCSCSRTDLARGSTKRSSETPRLALPPRRARATLLPYSL